MADFLWHLRGSAELDSAVTDADALLRIRGMLEKQRKRISSTGPNHLNFNSPLWTDWFGPNWLAMVVYDQGLFCVEETSGGRVVRYDLRSLQAFVFVSSQQDYFSALPCPMERSALSKLQR